MAWVTSRLPSPFLSLERQISVSVAARTRVVASRARRVVRRRRRMVLSCIDEDCCRVLLCLVVSLR
jgi:hypothetical protein